MKKDFRKKVIEYRNNKDTDFISTNSQKITEKLLSMNCIKDANTIMLYLDFNNEVKTLSYIHGQFETKIGGILKKCCFYFSFIIANVM